MRCRMYVRHGDFYVQIPRRRALQVLVKIAVYFDLQSRALFLRPQEHLAAKRFLSSTVRFTPFSIRVFPIPPPPVPFAVPFWS